MYLYISQRKLLKVLYLKQNVKICQHSGYAAFTQLNEQGKECIKFFIIGGLDTSSNLIKNNCLEGILDENGNVENKFISPMISARVNFGCTLCDDLDKFIYCVAGSNPGDIALCEIYDIAKKAWSPLPALSKSCSWPTLFIFNNKYLYCSGGLRNNKVIPFLETERLNVQKRDKWERIVVEQLNSCGWVNKVQYCGLQILSNEILICGGFINNIMKKECYRLEIDENANKHNMKKSDPLLLGEAFASAEYPIMDGDFALFWSNAFNFHFYSISNARWSCVGIDVWKDKLFESPTLELKLSELSKEEFDLNAMGNVLEYQEKPKKSQVLDDSEKQRMNDENKP